MVETYKALTVFLICGWFVCVRSMTEVIPLRSTHSYFQFGNGLVHGCQQQLHLMAHQIEYLRSCHPLQEVEIVRIKWNVSP